MELQANTASSLLFTLNNSAGWTGVQHATWSLTSSFQTFTFTANAFSNGHMLFHFNLTPPGFPTASTGTVNMRNLRVYTQTTSATISTGLTVNGAITCTSLTQTSDERVKDNVQLADLVEIQNIFNNVDVKTYERNDGFLGSRIGFIAQDFQNTIDYESKFQNIVNPIFTEPPLVGLDYSRLTTILWGVCKKQQELITNLDSRVQTLETTKTTAKAKKCIILI